MDIRDLIANGEGAQLEFKSTLRYDLRTKAVNKDLTKVVVKTLAAFSNTRGGTLLIGVADDGNVLGITDDLNTLSDPTPDRLELTLRSALEKHLGAAFGPLIDVAFVPVGGKLVVKIDCPRFPEPVYLQDGNTREFYVRDGNRSKSLDIRDAHSYIGRSWPADSGIKDTILDVLNEMRTVPATATLAGLQADQMPDPAAGDREEQDSSSVAELVEAPLAGPDREIKAVIQADEPPPWIRVSTRRVIDGFLRRLAGATGWQKIYLISPWVSDFSSSVTLSFDRFLERVVEERATIYMVTRPPEEDWHQTAIDRLAGTTRANIAFLPGLHAKLYSARTDTGSFALLGSANFTQASLENQEIGVLVNGYSDGRGLVRRLDQEAAAIYRSPGRTIHYHAQL
jgi:hypothetical protein